VLKTPAVDDKLAAAIGRPVTPHLVAPDEALATHLFLLPTSRSDAELLAAADGGLWISGLDPVECFDPCRLRFRATARGVRRIAGGELARAVPDLVWEDSLLELFNRVVAVGSETASWAMGGGLLGAVTSPALVVERAADLRLAVE
jgi:predicted Zn-dependent protease